MKEGFTELINSNNLINLSIDDYFQVNSFYLAMSPGYKTSQDIGYPQTGMRPSKG